MLVDAFGPARQRGSDEGQIGRCWILPMIYGHVDQASEFSIISIARQANRDDDT